MKAQNKTNNSSKKINESQLSPDNYSSQLSLLPRTGWQDRPAFFKVLIKAKRAIELAEITAFLN